MLPKPQIRAATPADFSSLQDIERSAGERFRDIGLPEIADDDPFTADDLLDAELLLVAEVDGLRVGYAVVDLVDGQAHLEQLSVTPAAGGKGVGGALIDAVMEWARARGDHAVTLTTFRDVPFNMPLYAKRGFVEVADSEWSPGMRALVAHEAAEGLDPAKRVVMRRPVG